MDRTKLLKDFTEIIAIHTHYIDMINNGVISPEQTTKGWRRRYDGIPKEELPPYCVQLNTFKMTVDNVAAMLMSVVDKNTTT